MGKYRNEKTRPKKHWILEYYTDTPQHNVILMEKISWFGNTTGYRIWLNEDYKSKYLVKPVFILKKTMFKNEFKCFDCIYKKIIFKVYKQRKMWIMDDGFEKSIINHICTNMHDVGPRVLQFYRIDENIKEYIGYNILKNIKNIMSNPKLYKGIRFFQTSEPVFNFSTKRYISSCHEKNTIPSKHNFIFQYGDYIQLISSRISKKRFVLKQVYPFNIGEAIAISIAKYHY